MFNGSPIKNIASGINGKRILGQGGNYRFLETIESTGISSASIIDELANTYKSVGESIHPAVVQFAKDWENVDEKIKETTSMTEYFASQNTTAFQKLGSILRNAVGKGFAMLGNAIMSMGISLIASIIISKITEVLTYYDRLKKETKSLVGEFESQSKSLHDNKTQYDELSQRYVELSKGVDALGHNLSLTTEEYDEYKSVVSQLVDLNPNLLQGYNDQNDAILTIKDSVDALTESYNENIKAANNIIIRGKDKIGEDYAVNMNSFNDADFQNDYDKLMATKAINDILTSPVIDEQTVQSILDQYGNDVTTLILSTLKDADFTYDSFETTAALIARASKDSIGKSALEASLSEYEATISEYTSGLNDFSQAFVENQIIDNKIDDNLGAIIKNIVSNKDADYFNQFVKEDNTFDFNALERDLLNIVNAFKGLTDKQIDDLQFGINLSTQWNNDELSYEEYIKQVQDFIKILNELFPDNEEIVKTFKLLFNIPDEEELAKQQDIFVNRLGEKVLNSKANNQSYTILTSEALRDESQKISDWGLEKYRSQIMNGTIRSRYGNIDMDNRKIIEYDEEYIEAHKEALKSWFNYDKDGNIISNYYDELSDSIKNGEKRIDTVYGGLETYLGNDDKSYDIAFSPILQTEDGGEILSKETVDNYINEVLAKAGEDGVITADEIFTIDAPNTGKQYGEQFGLGLIAGVNGVIDREGTIVPEVGELMHFSGRYGAWKIAEQDAEAVTMKASKAGMPSDVEKRLKAQGTEVADKWYDSLTKSQREFVDNVSDEDLAEAIKFDSTEQFDEWLAKLQAEADKNAILVKTKASESVSSIDSMRDAFGDDLISLYETTVTKAEKANGSDIEAVNSAFGGTTFNEEDFEKVNAMSNAIDQYNESLLESAGDATVAQDSLNKLANAYVDQSGVLNKLIDDGEDATEAEKQYYIEQLKATGITNARSVVESRLSKQYKASATALTNLSKRIAQNRSALDKGEEAGEEYTNAVNNITDEVNNLLAVYDEDGTKIQDLIPDVDENFITKHLEDIYAATEGDIDALKRLREAAARLNLAKVFVDVELPSDVVEARIDNIMDLVNQANNMDIEVGATVDDEAFIKTLENIIKTTNTSVEDINKAFEEIGFEASYEKTGTSELEVPELDLSAVNGSINSASDYQSAKTGKTKKIKVSNFALTVKKKSDYTGASVSYDGSTATTGSDSDSSGSDSDSNSNEDFSNSFDWIETAVNRVEESISRLDEQVNNTYTTWTKRNDNLAKEIDEVTKEIELQSDASKRYQELSEEVWIPETYKIKVQNGELDVEDIDASMVTDEIRTYFDNMLASGEGDSEMIEKYTEGTLIDGDYASMLSDAISEYQDLFDKSVEASDQVASLTIEKQGLYTQAFDNIQSMYEDLGGTIDKQVDLIEEHVTRAEEMGYFASERYYNQLLDLERTNNTNLSTELDDLVAKMNEAVAQGEIEKGSEAWYDMYDSVMDVNQQLEESATNVAKLQNELRQLSWDKFDWVEEQLADINAEAEFALGLLENEENYGDDGRFTDSGYARLSLIGAQYYDATERAERYRKELAELDKQFAEDPNDTNLIERRTEAMENWRDAISDSSQYVEDYRSVVKEAAEEQLSYLQDIIDKYKESLSSAKDLYDWEKNVRDQTDNIVDIQQQLTAYQNDDSEEARKRRQELQKQLDDAQQNLEESQWDRYISETGDMLDDMYDKYEEYLNTKIDEMGIEELMAIVNDGIGSAENGLNAIQEKYDYQLQYFNEFTNGKTVADIIDSINGVKDAYTSVTDAENNGTAQKVDGTTLELSVNEDGTISVSQVGGSKNLGSIKSTSGSWKQNDTGWWYEHDDGSYTTSGKETIDGKDYYFNDEGYMASNEYINGYHVASNGEIESSGNEWHNENGQWWYGKDDEYATGHVFIDGDWHTFDKNGWWVGQFANGIKHVNKTGIGVTQEDGTELIFRTSDGAMLTPLGQGDMVFTNEMSRRLWEIAKGDIPNGINIALPNMTNANSRDFNTTNNISIELPNVQNYEDFKREMKQDTELESFWQEITIGRMMGNNSLKKNRY